MCFVFFICLFALYFSSCRCSVSFLLPLSSVSRFGRAVKHNNIVWWWADRPGFHSALVLLSLHKLWVWSLVTSPLAAHWTKETFKWLTPLSVTMQKYSGWCWWQCMYTPPPQPTTTTTPPPPHPSSTQTHPWISVPVSGRQVDSALNKSDKISIVTIGLVVCCMVFVSACDLSSSSTLCLPGNMLFVMLSALMACLPSPRVLVIQAPAD